LIVIRFSAGVGVDDGPKEEEVRAYWLMSFRYLCSRDKKAGDENEKTGGEKKVEDEVRRMYSD